jgi:glycosyltransferase involved in cell wall biosynthesis
MASGLACVAYDYAAAREYATDGSNALLAVKGDEGGFLAAASRLANDTELRLGAAARDLAMRLSWGAVVCSYLVDVSSMLQCEGDSLECLEII